jgi:hypothetical protein
MPNPSLDTWFSRDDDEPIARGSNLWKKKSVTVSGERVAKVDRIAAQVS